MRVFDHARSHARRLVAVTLTVVMAAAFAVVGQMSANAQAPTARTGASSHDAAPSCWSIKQAYPDATDGTYWLQTPSLVAPERFHCDMTTDGGGWVLVARGREGWSFLHEGQRSPRDVRERPDGTNAFRPAALPAPTIDGLLDGGRVDALPDGVRIRRAADAAGTTWQEVRWQFADRDRWSWALGALHRLSSVSFDGVTSTNRTTHDTNVDNGRRRMFTYKWRNHRWRAGFSYGNAVSGSNSATTYLWTNSNENHALPFTQVYLRPRITEADVAYDAVPDAGLPAATLPALLSNRTDPALEWGVTGVRSGGATTSSGKEKNLEVHSFAERDGTMYVVGQFRYVQKGANPGAGERVEQSYVAAFDVVTGEWRSGFRPVVDGLVWDVQATPDGIVIAGEFSNVNGAPGTVGLAGLDPVTGDVLPGWYADVENRAQTNGDLAVRALDLEDGWLYVGGKFTHVTGGSDQFGPIQVGKAIRVDPSDGRPDPQWKPNFNGTIQEVDASSQGDRVYFSGHFTRINGVPANKVGAVRTELGAATVTGLKPYVTSTSNVQKQYQQTILEVGDTVWHGGSEHIFAAYERDDWTLVRSHVTTRGGDFQAAAHIDGVVYGASHSSDYNYQDSRSWPNPGNSWMQADPTNWVGAYDAATGAYLPDFRPSIEMRGGSGPWELTEDALGCMWVGGDLDRGSWHNGGYQWVGGFARLCPQDTAAPSTPGSVQTTLANGRTNLSWNASSDDIGVYRYEVLRDDRVIGLAWGTSWTDPSPALDDNRYFVRSVDARGNRSATSPVSVVTIEAPFAEVLGFGADWSYSYGDGPQPATWNTPAFDDSAWPAGPTKIGFGDGDIVTVLPDLPTPRPLTLYMRSTFDVTGDPADLSELKLEFARDDGIVVYVNGTEVARDNMPTGPVDHDTQAASGVSSRSEETLVRDVVLPADTLVSGQNTIAVRVHQANAWSADLAFDARLSVR